MHIVLGTLLGFLAIVALVYAHHARYSRYEEGTAFLACLAAVGLGASAYIDIAMPHTGFSYAVGVVLDFVAVVPFYAAYDVFTDRREEESLGRREKVACVGLLALGLILIGCSACQYIYVT